MYQRKTKAKVNIMTKKRKPFSIREYKIKALKVGFRPTTTVETRSRKLLQKKGNEIPQLKHISYISANNEDWKKLTSRTLEELEKVRMAAPGELEDFPMRAVCTELRGRRKVRQARRGALLGADRAST